jgi:poly(3-hydroxybutyrate) depolymerase
VPFPSIFATMRGGGGFARAGSRAMPAIVFHGDRDSTVHPRNGEAVVARAAPAEGLQTRIETGAVPGGHGWQRTLQCDADGRTLAEHWLIHGAGHAWSGGGPAGSFTDPRGPDATAEMLRFFLAHPHAAPAAIE